MCFAKSMDIKYNCKKCMVIRIGSHFNKVCKPFQLCGVELSFVYQIKYFAVFICNPKEFKVVYENHELKFYRCFNAIYSKFKGNNSEIVC